MYISSTFLANLVVFWATYAPRSMWKLRISTEITVYFGIGTTIRITVMDGRSIRVDVRWPSVTLKGVTLGSGTPGPNFSSWSPHDRILWPRTTNFGTVITHGEEHVSRGSATPLPKGAEPSVFTFMSYSVSVFPTVGLFPRYAQHKIGGILQIFSTVSWRTLNSKLKSVLAPMAATLGTLNG